MSKRGRAPFGRRKRKEAPLEDVPVIEQRNVAADTPPPVKETTPLMGRVTPDKDSSDIVHEYERLPVKTIYAEERQEASPMANIPQPFRRPQTGERTVIRGYNVEPAPAKEQPVPEVASPRLINEETGRATLISAAHSPPQKKGDKKIIRG